MFADVLFNGLMCLFITHEGKKCKVESGKWKRETGNIRVQG